MTPGVRRILARLGWTGEPPAAPTWVAYAIVPGDEVHNFVRRAQARVLARYRPGSLDDCPHITIKQAFQVEALEPAERYFDRLAGETEPFDLETDGVGRFEGHGIVYLGIRTDPRLEALRRRILADLSAQFGVRPYPLEDDRYRYHATLASGLSEADAAAALQALGDTGVGLRLRFDTLGLLCRTAGRRWVTYKRTALGRAGPRPSA